MNLWRNESKRFILEFFDGEKKFLDFKFKNLLNCVGTLSHFLSSPNHKDIFQASINYVMNFGDVINGTLKAS
jgi:hypothetical protein